MDQEKFYEEEAQETNETPQARQMDEVNDMRYFLELLKHIRAAINAGKSVPLTGKKIIDAEKCLMIIDDMEKNLPDAVQYGMQMYSERERIMGEAETRAMNRVSSAEMRANAALEKARDDAEQRVLEANPDSVLLRATWMYDMPMYGVANRGNFLVNMLRQPAQSFSGTQHRAVTYVQQVAELIRPAASLPGGIYNYGSENDLTMLQTAQWLKQELKLPVTLSDAGERHHLWMDCSKLKSFGICFDTTLEGLKRCIRDYSL